MRDYELLRKVQRVNRDNMTKTQLEGAWRFASLAADQMTHPAMRRFVEVRRNVMGLMLSCRD